MQSRSDRKVQQEVSVAFPNNCLIGEVLSPKLQPLHQKAIILADNRSKGCISMEIGVIIIRQHYQQQQAARITVAPIRAMVSSMKFGWA